jgi:23S rRNA (cytosine1962-C5)-methyltransferase
VNILRLKPGKERAALKGHPWIFDTAVARGGAEAGETLRVESDTGQFLGWAAYSPTSKIRARIWSFNETEWIDAVFFKKQITAAVHARTLFDIQSTGLRLVHGESDGIPGLIVDRYDNTLVAQFLSSGVERFKPMIAQALVEVTGCVNLFERSDSGVRSLEGLSPVKGWLVRDGEYLKQSATTQATTESAAISTTLTSSASEGRRTQVIIREHDWKLGLDIEEGHKTGFYLDQRDSRKLFRDYAQRLGFKRVLNCYCYTGGFTVAALKGMLSAGTLNGDAKVVSIDSSLPALNRAREQLDLNQLDPQYATFLDADVNASLRQFIKDGQEFDAIVLDPPKFAPSAAHTERAARAYKDINRLAFKLLKTGGVLFTFSCSGGISADLFHKIVASAGSDAEVDGYILQRLGAACDHPMSINFPEGEYLKGLVVLKK